MTVSQIQAFLFQQYKLNFGYFSPNTKAFGKEADLIAITKKGVVTEFEIKRSRGDFFAELTKKRVKHEMLSRAELTPAYFYFVCTNNIIQKKDVPRHAGLLYVQDTGRIITIKKAPRLHSRRASETEIIKALRSLMFKYFSEKQIQINTLKIEH